MGVEKGQTITCYICHLKEPKQNSLNFGPEVATIWFMPRLPKFPVGWHPPEKFSRWNHHLSFDPENPWLSGYQPLNPNFSGGMCV